MKEALRAYKSQDGQLIVYKVVSNRKLEADEIETLLKEGKVGPLDGFRSKAGKPFSAMLTIDNGKPKLDFGGGADGENGDEAIDLSQFEVVGKDPKTGAPVHSTPNAYISESYEHGNRDSGFRMSRTLLGKAIETDQVKKLLSEGKTDLIKGFRSKRTNRLFDAFLITKGTGIGFEFPPRPAKKKKAKKSS
jgi:DNA topoisomerase-3